MTKEQARIRVENRGYRVVYDMSAQAYLAIPTSSLRGRYTKANTLNGLEVATRVHEIHF